MHIYITKRLLLIIPIVFGVIVIVFFILGFAPGDPGRLMLGMNAPQEAVDRLNEELGLNDPFLTRFFRYIKDLSRGDFGISYRSRQPVFDDIMASLPVTLKLSFATMTTTILIGIPLGVLAAVRQYSRMDVISTFTALLLAAAPAFWLALMMILLFSLKLGWLPPTGPGGPSHYVMPVLTQSLVYAGAILRMTRSSMLESVRQDYVRTARGKGAPERRVIWRHAIRNALLPVITTSGIYFSGMLGGTIVIEQVFGLPGMGTLIIKAIMMRDIPQVMAVTIFISAMFSLIMLVVDLLYAFVDPRIKARFASVRWRS